MFPQLATHLGIGADVHGALLAAGRGAALAAFVALQLLTFWRTRLWPLWVAQACCAASIVWIGLANATWMFATAWVIGGAVSGYAYQASIYFTLEEMSEKGKGSGFHEAMVGSGMFFGPMLAGWVGNSHGLRTPYLFCAAALLALIVAQMILVFWRRTGPRTPPPPRLTRLASPHISHLPCEISLEREREAAAAAAFAGVLRPRAARQENLRAATGIVRLDHANRLAFVVA